MDAIKFVETLQRKYKIENENKIVIHVDEDANFLVNFIEEWSKEHPTKTRQSVFLEQYPCAKIDKQDVLYVCPAVVCGDNACPKNKVSDYIICRNCRREFWMQEAD